LIDTVESGDRYRYTPSWDHPRNHMDVGSKCRDSLNHSISLKIPVNPPYFKRPKTPLNDLSLPVKNYYTTGDICKVLNIKPDTFRQRIYRGFYPEFQKIAGKRKFSEEQIKGLIRLTEELIKKKTLFAGKSD